MKKCKVCKESIAPHNKSGYCSKCSVHSPKMLEYQRIKQKEYHQQHPEKRKEYNRRPEVKKRKSKLFKKWMSNPKNRIRMRELKRNWARKKRYDEKNKKREKTNKKTN